MIGALFGGASRFARSAAAATKEAKLGEFFSRQFGGSSIKQRALIGGGFFGAASLTGSYYDAVERQLSSYYGEEKYEEMYAGGVRGRKGMATFALKAQGVMGLLGRDLISRGMGSAKYFSKVGQSVSAKRAALKGREYISPSGDVLPTSPRKFNYAREFRNEMKFGVGKDINTPRLGLGAVGFGVGMGLSASDIGVSPFAVGALGGAIGIGMSTLRGASNVTRMSVGVKGDLARAREFGLVGKAGTKAESSFIKKRLAMTAGIMAVGVGAGAGLGLSHNAPLPEGNIIDFSRHNESGVSRMNFSTAGLVQALHRSNSRY